LLPDPYPYFARLPDPCRETKNKQPKLEDMIIIGLCSVLSGIEDWVGMETFAEEREDWFRGLLALSNGIPSHDTFSSVMGRLDPEALMLFKTEGIKKTSVLKRGESCTGVNRARLGCWAFDLAQEEGERERSHEHFPKISSTLLLRQAPYGIKA
jgi:hypothetical protein